MRCAVRIPFKGDRRHSNDRSFGEALFEVIVFLLTFRQPMHQR